MTERKRSLVRFERTPGSNCYWVYIGDRCIDVIHEDEMSEIMREYIKACKEFLDIEGDLVYMEAAQ